MIQIRIGIRGPFSFVLSGILLDIQLAKVYLTEGSCFQPESLVLIK